MKDWSNLDVGSVVDSYKPWFLSPFPTNPILFQHLTHKSPTRTSSASSHQRPLSASLVRVKTTVRDLSVSFLSVPGELQVVTGGFKGQEERLHLLERPGAKESVAIRGT